MGIWTYDPHSGGIKIASDLQAVLLKAIAEYSVGKRWYYSHQLVLRFKNQFCYVDTLDSSDKRQFPLCRLRHFSANSFSLALFTYSNDKYEVCYFPTGSATGTFVEALDVCEPLII